MKIVKRIAVVLLVILVMLSAAACGDDGEKAEKQKPAPKLTAEEQAKKDFEAKIPEYRIAAKEVIKDTLASPSTAKFPDEAFEGDQWPTMDSGDTVYISSWVDAENGMGGTVRNTFTVYLTKDTMECKYLSFNGDVVYDYLEE